MAGDVDWRNRVARVNGDALTRGELVGLFVLVLKRRSCEKESAVPAMAPRAWALPSVFESRRHSRTEQYGSSG
jgi:hypothetical protein